MKQKQHFLSRFYLTYFVDPTDRQTLFVYEKGGKPMRRSRPANEGFKKDYYVTYTPEGERDTNTIEQEMARVEGMWKPSLDRLLNRGPLDLKDRTCIAGFISLTAMRSPLFHESMRKSLEKRYNRDWSQDRLQILKSSSGTNSTVSKWCRRLQCTEEELRELSKETNVWASYPLSNCLEAINWSNSLADVLAKMQWTFLVAPKGYNFVTSDSPVYPEFAVAALEKGIQQRNASDSIVQNFPQFLTHVVADEETNLTFPFSPHLAFFAGCSGTEGYVDASAENVEEVNHRTIKMAKRWVYASVESDALDRQVQLHTGSRERLLGQ